MVGAKSAVECSFRILSCSVLGHMFFYFVVLVYITINFSLLNLILILLIILDVLSLQNIQKYALSISSLPSRPRRRSVFCSRQDEEEQYRISRSDTRSSGSTLLTNAPNNEVHVSLNEDAHFSFWAASLCCSAFSGLSPWIRPGSPSCCAASFFVEAGACLCWAWRQHSYMPPAGGRNGSNGTGNIYLPFLPKALKLL